MTSVIAASGFLPEYYFPIYYWPQVLVEDAPRIQIPRQANPVLGLDNYPEYNVVSDVTYGLSFSHPHRGSTLYQDDFGEQLFESYIPPFISVQPDDIYAEVKSNDPDALRLLAHRIYGNFRFWRIIAAANDIIDPIQDIEIGMVLRCPAPARIFSGGLVKVG